MRYVDLGNTGLRVSEVAFGGVEIGLPYGIGVRSEADMLQEREAVNLLSRSLEEGINFFDTARMYGESERLMGIAFASKRDQVVISSKCRHFRDQKGQLPESGELTQIIHRSVEESLLALRTDYLDLFMLHQADEEILQREEIIGAFLALKQSGKVRSIGASTYTVAESTVAVESGIWQVVQLPFNLLDQRQATVFDGAANRGVGLVIRSVLLKGLLSERGKNLPLPLERVEEHIQKLADLAGTMNIDLTTLAIRFALSFEAVSSVLVGIDRESYLLHAIEAARNPHLDENVFDTVKRLAFPDPEFIDLPHWDRMGWLT
ncbi:MAG: aldo/keto reductase [Lunatimonas sp.]|uniref:aldo/keto reductase n=1 Tax=Lunatimonas sp. TaxID=2060141 RepID=UPI00263B76A1|nr:aldo/keto reductase [Lunatimonas sp.]MCC5938343.1 aldo/keto reductase [Lunatimonas sp.]